MPARQPLPRLWLMTDERQGDGLMRALGRLPEGAGIVFRHYSLDGAARRALFDAVKAAARPRNILIMLGGPSGRARLWGADGSHGRGRGRGLGLRSTSVHNFVEIRAAERAGADFLFLSPVFPTRSHPGAPCLGSDGFARLARLSRLPVIALGGMTAERAEALGAYGWAGIDAWDV